MAVARSAPTGSAAGAYRTDLPRSERRSAGSRHPARHGAGGHNRCVLPPAAADSAGPARWVQARYVWGGPWVTREVGTGFQAYIRVFHPYLQGDNARTWAEVAAAHGKVMHPVALWEEITADGPWDPDRDYNPNRNGAVDLQGDLPQPVLGVVCDVLGRHTATPDDCYFAVWDGWGWDHSVTLTFTRPDADDLPTERVEEPDPGVRLDPNAPRFGVRGRDFLLYRGKVEQATQIGGGDYYPSSGFLMRQSPTLMWPADHAWCLSTELDAEYTIIGGTQALADDLVNTPGIEAALVSPTADPVTDINQ